MLDNTEVKQTPLQSNIEKFSKKLGVTIFSYMLVHISSRGNEGYDPS